ncbi:low-complexity tail membrane protein [Cyanobium sp. ATX 6F1]|uniref:low-complexity tail membrane protein n=1 Tax=Cyanobium sp. ATX 6F1 TaxID=2823702 RepID=UPI0020CCEA2B|nr:low-complexity tail membrane protein [Cyanobium sp. ATX 6F1]MCP9916804.1 low-complexity tail membrane protein [Cyanobium sp. ATX 6F1]
MTPRSEALLWIQLLGLAALPLEVLLLLVLLAGADPGPVPALERLLVWGLGALLPAVLLWKRPPDLWSLVLVQVPLRGRRPLQQRLSALQAGLGLQLSRAAGAALLLPLTWWADQQAGLATGLSPFAASGRLVVLLLSVPLLALMLWQWQQLVQALRLLSLDQALVDGATPLSLAQLEQSRLSLGLPLLLFDPLRDKEPAAAEGSREHHNVQPDAPALESGSESADDPLASETQGPSALEASVLEAQDSAGVEANAGEDAEIQIAQADELSAQITDGAEASPGTDQETEGPANEPGEANPLG